jgi:hypothetical protein
LHNLSLGPRCQLVRCSNQTKLPFSAGAAPLVILLYRLFTEYSTYILLHHHNTMDPPPRPPYRTEPATRVLESQPSPEDDLLAISGRGLQPSLSPIPLSQASSPQDISPRTLPSPSFASPRSLHADARINDPPSNDDLLHLPQSTSPNPASLELTTSAPPPPDELIFTMPQYQPVSAGSTANPRAMSQVSPGFIFVNFLSQSVCCFFRPESCPRYPPWYLHYHVSYLLSPLS